MLERALNISEAIPAPIWVTHAQTDLGAALAQRGAPGDTERAKQLLERAHIRALELGLRRLARAKPNTDGPPEAVSACRAGATDPGWGKLVGGATTTIVDAVWWAPLFVFMLGYCPDRALRRCVAR